MEIKESFCCKLLLFLALVVLFILLGRWIQLRYRRIRKFPPEISILGIVFRFCYYRESLLTIIHQCRYQFGDIFCILSWWRYPIVVVGGCSTLHAICSTRGFSFTGRPTFATMRKYKEGLFTSEGDLWRSRSATIREAINEISDEISQNHRDRMPPIMDTLRGKQNIKFISRTAVLSTLHWKCFGVAIYDADIYPIVQAIDEIFSCEQTLCSYLFPALTKLTLRARMSYIRAIACLESYIEVKIRQNPQRHQVDKDANSDNLVTKMRSRGLNTETIAAMVTDLLILGTISTGSSISWALIHLAEDNELQTRIRHEIQEGRGKDHMDNTECNSLIKEVYRLHPPFPMGLPRRVLYDTLLLGYLIPSTALVLCDLTSVLHDNVLWSKPEDFNVDRFCKNPAELNGGTPESENGGTDYVREKATFSSGKRICIMEKWAEPLMIEIVGWFLKNVQIQHVNDINSKKSLHRTNSASVKNFLSQPLEDFLLFESL